LLGALLVSFALLWLWWQAGRWYQTQLLTEQRASVAEDVALRGNTLSSAINRRLARLQGLYAFVQTARVSEDLAVWPEFETFAAVLYAESKGIRNLAVAPEGVVRFVYPFAGNEQVLGYEPLKDTRPEVRADVQRAIETRQIILSGPIELIQGGLGLIARQAVYQGDDFWGLINVVVDVPTILEEAELVDVTSDLDLALRDVRGRVFYGSSGVFEHDPVITRIELPEGEWELAGLPGEGWVAAVRNPLLVSQVAGLIIVGLLVSLTYSSVNRQARLGVAVQQRTHELQTELTARARIETTLREREAQYRGIYESTTDGLFINDLQGRLVDFNPAAAHIHGYTPEEFRQLQTSDFIHPDSLSVFSEYIETVKAGGQFRGRALDLRKDGTPFPIEVLGTGFIYRGQPHALAVVRDITKEVQSVQLLERRVEQRTRELSTLLELSNKLASTLEMEPLLGLILEQLAQAIDYTGATVLISEGDSLQAKSHRGPVPPSMVNQMRLSLEQVKTFWSVMLRHKPLIVDDAQADTEQAESYRRATSVFPDVATNYVRAWMGIPLLAQERLVGALSIGHKHPNTYTSRHADLALAIANQAAVAIENARLYEQARRLAVLEERQRLARELHDSVSQALYGIGMSANTARALLERDPEQAAGPLDYAISLAEAGLMEMRALIFELRPDSLDKEELASALTRQAMALRARHNLHVQTDFCQEPVLPFETKEALYRIAQEALNNIIKHAQASRVDLNLENCEGEIILHIQDDGVGFDPQAGYPGHLGLHSMHERATQLGGRLIIQSTPGAGTSIRVQIPSST